MKYRKLPSTDLEVSEIGIGAFPMAGIWIGEDGRRTGWPGVSDSESIALIQHAESLGVNLIDTAEGYGDGHSEDVVGRALRGRRDRWIIATKVSPNRDLQPDVPDPAAAAARIREGCEGSLRRLGTDVIDLYQLHAVPFAWALGTQVNELDALKRDGKIRHWGISTDDADAVRRLRALGSVQILQVRYNMLQQESDGLLREALSAGIGTLIRVPLAKGLLSGRYFEHVDLPADDLRYERFQLPEIQAARRQLPRLTALTNGGGRSLPQAALRFCLDHPGVTCVIAGAKTRAQIEDNAGASEVASLTNDERAVVDAVAAEVTIPHSVS